MNFAFFLKVSSTLCIGQICLQQITALTTYLSIWPSIDSNDMADKTIDYCLKPLYGVIGDKVWVMVNLTHIINQQGYILFL